MDDIRLKRDKEGILRENMIIKGNNLIALHTLKTQYRNKIKLIYIDPPYNTGGEANIFTYNNNFNHSTWLTFMKNRLEIARELLTKDGFICIAIDHNELFYLGTITDEIFGRENRLGIVTVVTKSEGRQFTKGVNPTNEFMLWYSNTNGKSRLSNYSIDEQELLKFDCDDELGKFMWIDYIRLGGGESNLRINKPENWFPVYVSKDLSKISLEYNKDYYEVFPITKSGVERTWNTSIDTFLENIKKGSTRVVNDNGNLKVLRKLRPSKSVKTHWFKT